VKVKVNLSVCLIEHHGMKTGGSASMLQAFLTSIVDEELHAPAALSPLKQPPIIN
jgi:hypothetical protein